jgi:glycine/D-amino acid oxidase-like deaminating enzyme
MGRMIHDAAGWWVREAGLPAPRPPLAGSIDVDVLVVGGGFSGLWTAWHVLQAEPDARVVVLEAGRCGLGPSGRNGGFVNSLWLSLPALRERFGDPRALELAEASRASVTAIGRWCAAEGVDAWFRAAPHPVVAAAPAQEGVSADAVDGDEVTALDREATQAICAAPRLGAGVLVRTAATIHPARLVLGLRERLLARGARIFEGTRVLGLRDGVAETDGGGRVRAGATALALGAHTGTLRALRRTLTVGSSHVVLTEPVPDVLEALGWTGGEAITDGRALLHYTRTTPDGRILFGWAGGRMAAGARPGGRMEVDAAVVAQVARDLVAFFPMLAGRRIEHAWGGPIDVAPTHLPSVTTLPGGRAFAVSGFTGNGVGPAHLAGRVLASLALDRRDDASRLALVDPSPESVPPEPLRVAGAALIRRALVRREAAEEEGGRADPVTRAVTELPERLGMHIVR